jgi:hypothetical protein
MTIIRCPFIVCAVAAGLTAAGCAEPAAPVVGATSRWALVSIDDEPLPTKPAAGFLAYVVLADTLTFGVESSYWKPRPLARAVRVFRLADGTGGIEELWYTYTEPGPMPTSFDIRMLCPDGDSTADCIDASGRATADASGLTFRFNVRVFGVLRYVRVP